MRYIQMEQYKAQILKIELIQRSELDKRRGCIPGAIADLLILKASKMHTKTTRNRGAAYPPPSTFLIPRKAPMCEQFW